MRWLIATRRNEAHPPRNLVTTPADLIVRATPRDKSARILANEQPQHATDNDCVGMSLNAFVDFAVEHADRIGKTQNPAWQGQPTPLCEALGSSNVGIAGEPFGELALVGCQDTDRECTEAHQGGVARQRATNAEEQCWRIGPE